MLYTRNHVLTVLKNYELMNLFRIVPVLFAVEMSKILYLVAHRRLGVAFAAIRGILEVFRDMRTVLVKRQRVARIREVSDGAILKGMHPFNPITQSRFLVLQSEGERLVLASKPPYGMFDEREGFSVHGA